MRGEKRRRSRGDAPLVRRPPVGRPAACASTPTVARMLAGAGGWEGLERNDKTNGRREDGALTRCSPAAHQGACILGSNVLADVWCWTVLRGLPLDGRPEAVRRRVESARSGPRSTRGGVDSGVSR